MNINAQFTGAAPFSTAGREHQGREKQGHIFRPAAGGLVHPAIRYPGFQNDPNTKRLDIACGRARLVRLEVDDLLEITNRDGAASIWLMPFSDGGALAGHVIGLSQAADALDADAFHSTKLLAWQRAQGAQSPRLEAYRIFDEQTEPDELFVIKAQAPVDLWLINPFPQDITGPSGSHFVAMHKLAKAKDQFVLPEPLGDIREEMRVDAASALAYELKEGEFVQIIDVEGRQCSDFMALRASALDEGVERYIDSTVTRSMVGGAYPGPGLFDKFYDQDMRPLLAVTRDTVGRHDTFALACTARGYEERGFPGHINCSDNISHAYRPFGIGEKSAWPAINFFFNSEISPTDNRIQSDEAWSRPGDYVVMQALSDLVCVSTACPDDVDPINGWNPTDIHVRIYRPENKISRAISYRPHAAPEAEPVMSEHSAFHPRTSAITNQFAPARDLWLPSQYDGIGTVNEYWACREAVSVQDMSSLRKFDILGPDAETLLNLALTKDVKRLAVHRGFYALLCDNSGAVIDDGTLFRLEGHCFRWACGSEESGLHLQDLAKAHGLKVWIKSLSSAMPNLAIQGPKSRDLMRDIIFTQPHMPSVDAVKWFGSTIARLHHREGPAFLLTRSGYTGELGYEIFCAEKDALEIWDGIMNAGEKYGIKPMGGQALEIIRIEAGLMGAAGEFTPDVDAFEAGLGFAVDFRKPEFMGRDALERARDHPKRQLVGLKYPGKDLPSHGDHVYAGRRQTGIITSATYSPLLDAVIALARINVEHSAEGTELESGRLDGQMKRLPCEVVSFPFFDPRRERARA